MSLHLLIRPSEIARVLWGPYVAAAPPQMPPVAFVPAVPPAACQGQPASDPQHLWIRVNVLLTSYPASAVKRCCHCGAEVQE